MYSNNDFRSYSENHLEHGWGWKPAQKAREKEYNAWYYATHPEKWGVKNALENLEDKVDDKVSDALDKGLLGKTDLDNKLYNAGKSVYSRMKSKTEKAIVNTGKKNLTSSAMKLERARRNFEAQRDNPRASSSQKLAATQAYRKAQAEYNATARGRAERAIDSRTNRAAQTAEKGYNAAKTTAGNVRSGAQQLQSDARYRTTSAKRDARVNADLAGRNLRRNVDSAVDSVKDRINTAVRNSNTKIDDNLLGAARALKNRDTNAAKNHLSNVGREIANTPGNIKNRVNEAIDNSNTKVDDRLRSAYGAAKSGNKAATGMYLRSAGKAAVSETKDAINRRIDESKTTADDNLRRAYRSARDGNTGEAKYYARSAASEIGRDAKNLARNAAGAVAEGGRRAAGAAEKAVREGYGKLTNDRYDERNYTDGAQRRTSNQGPNYNPREVGSNATQNERRQEEYNSRSVNPKTGRLNRTATVNTNTARDNGDLTPIQKNRASSSNETPAWFENFAEAAAERLGVAQSKARNAVSKASREIERYQKMVQKYGSDSNQAQSALADAREELVSSLTPNQSVSDSGTRSSYNDTAKQQRSQIQNARSRAAASSSSNSTNDSRIYSEGGKRRQSNHADAVYDPELHRMSTRRSSVNASEQRARDERDTINNVRNTAEELLDALVRNSDVGRIVTTAGSLAKKKKK